MLFDGLQVRRHGGADTEQLGVVQQFAVLRMLSRPRQAQRLDGDLQTKFVPEFEAVSHRACGIVDSDRQPPDAMCFQARVEGPGIEAMHGHGYRQFRVMVAAAGYGQVDSGGDPGRDAVVGERTNQADGCLGYVCRDDGQIGMFGFAGIGQVVEATTEFDYLTLIAQCV